MRDGRGAPQREEPSSRRPVVPGIVCTQSEGPIMGLGRGLLLWLLGIPLPIIILLAIFWH
jgi:hypothetical protein